MIGWRVGGVRREIEAVADGVRSGRFSGGLVQDVRRSLRAAGGYRTHFKYLI